VFEIKLKPVYPLNLLKTWFLREKSAKNELETCFFAGYGFIEVWTNVVDRIYRQQPAKNLHKTRFNSHWNYKPGLSTVEKSLKPFAISQNSTKHLFSIGLHQVLSHLWHVFLSKNHVFSRFRPGFSLIVFSTMLVRIFFKLLYRRETILLRPDWKRSLRVPLCIWHYFRIYSFEDFEPFLNHQGLLFK
jgi:hypothetical protein